MNILSKVRMVMQYVRKTAILDGKRYEVRAKTESEAISKLAEKLSEAKLGSNAIGKNMTVSSWYKEWKSTYKDSKGLTEKSLAMYDQKFNNYIKPAIGNMKLKDVRDIHLQMILNGQSVKSESHVNKIMLVLK